MAEKQVGFDKWKSTITLVIVICGAFGSGIYFAEDRYAKQELLKQHIAEEREQFKQLNEQASDLVRMMTVQLHTRKTILELKQAEQAITPSEIVELNNLRELLNN